MSSLHNSRRIALAIPRLLPPHSFTVPDQPSLRRSAAAKIRDKIAGGEADGPMGLVTAPPDLPPVLPAAGVILGPDDEPAEGELESMPAAPIPVILDAPIFSRVGANTRARQQQLKPVPTIL
jgi:hypothetical protein